MKKQFCVSILISLFILNGCKNESIVIENFDNTAWQQDPFGCKGHRADQAHFIMSNKEKLLGISDNKLIDFLGKPDSTRLHARNQKFLYYEIDGAKECNNEKENTTTLVIRLNATSLVSEITLYD